jgi:hypothetical protein
MAAYNRAMVHALAMPNLTRAQRAARNNPIAAPALGSRTSRLKGGARDGKGGARAVNERGESTPPSPNKTLLSIGSLPVFGTLSLRPRLAVSTRHSPVVRLAVVVGGSIGSWLADAKATMPSLPPTTPDDGPWDATLAEAERPRPRAPLCLRLARIRRLVPRCYQRTRFRRQ